MIEQIDFMQIKEKCPIGYDRFKKFLAQYEFGNFCYTMLDTYERYGMGTVKIDHQISAFFGWLDKFFEENGIVVNLSLVHNVKVDKGQLQHEAKATHYPEITDLVRGSHWSGVDFDRIAAWKSGFVEAFLMLEERL